MYITLQSKKGGPDHRMYVTDPKNNLERKMQNETVHFSPLYCQGCFKKNVVKCNLHYIKCEKMLVSNLPCHTHVECSGVCRKLCCFKGLLLKSTHSHLSFACFDYAR